MRKLIMIVLTIGLIAGTAYWLWPKEPVVWLQAHHDSGAAGVTLILMEDGTFTLRTEYLTTITDYKGTYTLHNDVIVLNKTQFDNLTLTGRLRPAACPGYPSMECLIQLDTQDQPADTDFVFAILKPDE